MNKNLLFLLISFLLLILAGCAEYSGYGGYYGNDYDYYYDGPYRLHGGHEFRGDRERHFGVAPGFGEGHESHSGGRHGGKGTFGGFHGNGGSGHGRSDNSR